ncbi:hypothetical protein CJ030_MR4G023630 [Morella rubra]|uniref:GRF-type domain-containing protein n=1 Tax=Morella rubra TaxID=262757 RepID=A0A6A1VZG5_9ROSI|nr:hypothetical protein CJ030_MR4G023630 [Morella rubra]
MLAEALAAQLASTLAAELKLAVAVLEGDSCLVIAAPKKEEQDVDWIIWSSSSVRDHRSGWESPSKGGLVEPPACLCGAQATIRTSLTKRNPGRHFYGCPFFGGTPVSTLEMKAAGFVI